LIVACDISLDTVLGAHQFGSGPFIFSIVALYTMQVM